MPIRSVANDEASTRCQARVVVSGVTANQASTITKSPERIIQGRWYQAASIPRRPPDTPIVSREAATAQSQLSDPDRADVCHQRVAQSSLLEIAQCLGVAIKLLLIESRGLLEYGGRVGGRSALLLEVSETLAEGKMTGQLDKANEIAALSATVAVKEIFAGVDIERRSGFWMQGTESDELVAVSGGPGGPMLLS
jgi:hypothetical protein